MVRNVEIVLAIASIGAGIGAVPAIIAKKLVLSASLAAAAMVLCDVIWLMRLN